MTIANTGKVKEDEGVCMPCTPEEERRIVEELTKNAEADLKEGDVYYVISNRWFVDWKKYVGILAGKDLIGTPPNHSHNGRSVEESRRPGPIDNSDIIISTSPTEKDEPQLIKGLTDGQDYALVPEEVWEKLFNWYSGGPPLPRKMIAGGSGSIFSVEVYPLLLNLIDSRDGEQLVLQFSKKDSVRKLYDKVCLVTGVEEDKTIISNYFNRSKQSVLLVSEQSLEDVPLTLGQDIPLEMKEDMAPAPFFEFGMDSTGNELALVAVEPPRSSLSIPGGPFPSNSPLTDGNSSIYKGGSLSSGIGGMGSKYNITNKAPVVERGGLAGLKNLGNTCFMNSAIQCLAHTSPIAKYFLDDYSEDINTENPLGTQGKLALAFGELLRKLWFSGHSVVDPSDFKSILGRFFPQFSGYAQHDSQEFLAFFLDGLHEDLNRIKTKPYNESKVSDGGPDDEVAKEWWKNHRAHNDSFIVDVCQGQYKSTLTCPVCRKISIKFDTFMSLPLPIASDTTRSMTVTVLSGDGRDLPMTYTVTVQQHGSVKNLLKALSSVCLNDESLLLAEVYEHKIYKYFENPTEELSTIKDEDCLVAYRLQKKQVTSTKLEIYSGEYKFTMDGSRVVGKECFGCPLVTYLDEKYLTGDGIWSTVTRVLSPFRKKTMRHPEFQSEQENSTRVATDATEKCHAKLRDVETTHMSTCILSMNLHFDEANGSEGLTKNTVLLPGQLVRVFLDWTDTVHKFYNSSYLATIPVVKGDVPLDKTKHQSLTLLSCLESFSKEEPLGLNDAWYCSVCKEHRQATTKLDLWRLPDILIFQFKRFSYNRYGRKKLDYFIDFPIHDVDLSKYVKSGEHSSQSYVYELYAIINHYGVLEGGHYTAYVKLMDEDKWFHFDDSCVTPISESNIKTGAAYVLFYQRIRSKTMMDIDQPSKDVDEPFDDQSAKP